MIVPMTRASRLEAIRELVSIAQSTRDLIRDSEYADASAETYVRMRNIAHVLMGEAIEASHAVSA